MHPLIFVRAVIELFLVKIIIEATMTHCIDIIILEVYRCMVKWNRGKCLTLKMDAMTMIFEHLKLTRRKAIKNALRTHYNDELPQDNMTFLLSGDTLYCWQCLIHSMFEK